MTAWKYSTTIKSTSPDYPALALAAAAPIPSSLDTLLASSTLQLDIRVLADGQQLGASSLEGSALLREVRGWFDEQKGSLGFDSVGDCEPNAAGVSSPQLCSFLTPPAPKLSTHLRSGKAVALNAFSRSARSSMLSRHAVQPQASDATASQGVDRLDLTLSFRSTSGRSKAKKPKLSVSSSDSQTQSHSQSQSPETASQTQLSQPPEVTLTSHLLSPSSLHFTLVPQLTTALERLAKKLVVAFPLCFNPKWQDRLANDLSAQHSIAQSLCNILGLDASKDRSIKPHDAEVEKKAGLLELTLNSHVNARFPANGPLAPPSTASSPPTDTTAKSLETALLLIAKNASAPDAWTPTKAGAEGGDGESESKTGRKTGVKGKRKAKEDEGGVEGAGTSRKKRNTGKSRLADAHDLSAFSTSSTTPSSATLAYEITREEDGQDTGESEAELARKEQELDDDWDFFGNAWG